MKRIIIKAPEGIGLDLLTAGQQTAVKSVFAQFALPMPGTKPHGGHIIIDAVVDDALNVDAIADLGLPFFVMGLWQWGGSGGLVEIQPLDGSFGDYCMPRVFNDAGGNPVTVPGVYEPHRWAGWPEAF